jgi:hypothetical protein
VTGKSTSGEGAAAVVAGAVNETEISDRKIDQWGDGAV